jgi:hypothetical protein
MMNHIQAHDIPSDSLRVLTTFSGSTSRIKSKVPLRRGAVLPKNDPVSVLYARMLKGKGPSPLPFNTGLRHPGQGGILV